MKLSRKAILSILVIIVLTTSGIVVWSQFLQPNEIVVMETSMGNIEIQLDRQHAPVTVDNFVKYVKTGFYDGTIFHRAEAGFVIQGGGYTQNETEKATNAAITLESSNGLKNLFGTIAMARTNSPNSATSQFFINLDDNTNLDYKSVSSPGYAVFGKVVSGIDVMNNIGKVKVETRNVTVPGYGKYPFQMWPIQDIVITRAYMKP
jgi:cyclophilin family peptidyl-prolyl cis-trans isomerase